MDVVTCRRSLPFFLLLALCLGDSGRSYCQVVPSAKGGSWITAGGMLDGDHMNYGSRNLFGATGFVDLNFNPRYTVEGEATWLWIRQQENVHDETYMIGPRFNFNDASNWKPYVKALIGNGQFNFPFNYAHGGYLVLAGGGGINYRLNRKFAIRVADVEYQYWPQFTFGALSSVQVSSGFQIRIREDR